MDSNLLRTFIAVAECRSFSKAAGAVNTNQSTVSRQVMTLEAACKLRLFDRVGRQVVLTATGDQLLPMARAILAAEQAFNGCAQELAGEDFARIRVGATIQTIQSVVSPVARAFQEMHPRCAFDFLEGTSTELLSRLEDGEIHVAVAWDPGRSPIAGTPLFELYIDAIVPEAHRFASADILEVREMAEQRMLLMQPGYMTRQMFEGACQSIGIDVTPCFESHSPQTLANVANDGHGIALIPSTATRTVSCPDARVMRVMHRGQPLSHWMSVLTDQRRLLGGAVERFVAFLHEKAKCR